VIGLSEDPLLNKDLRYLVVLQLSFRNPKLQELLLSGTHYQTPSPHWLQYHPSEAICLLHHARRRADSIAEIYVRIYLDPDPVCRCVFYMERPQAIDSIDFGVYCLFSHLSLPSLIMRSNFHNPVLFKVS